MWGLEKQFFESTLTVRRTCGAATAITRHKRLGTRDSAIISSCTITAMRSGRQRVFVVLVVAAWASLTTVPLACSEPISSLKPSNYVNDFAGVLSSAIQDQLNEMCRQIEQRAQAQIAVVTVKSTDGQDIFNYAVDLYQKWGIGQKGKDRGVLILLAVQDRKYWTTVGYGLEPILPDGKVGGFGREAVPYLKNGDYNGAISLLTSRVIDAIAKDANVQITTSQPRRIEPLTSPPQH